MVKFRQICCDCIEWPSADCWYRHGCHYCKPGRTVRNRNDYSIKRRGLLDFDQPVPLVIAFGSKSAADRDSNLYERHYTKYYFHGNMDFVSSQRRTGEQRWPGAIGSDRLLSDNRNSWSEYWHVERYRDEPRCRFNLNRTDFYVIAKGSDAELHSIRADDEFDYAECHVIHGLAIEQYRRGHD
jgi:hypothetical protein